MKLEDIKVGMKVRVRSWEDMEKEFGLNELGSIDVLGSFTDFMKHLCGSEATVKKVGSDEYVELDGITGAHYYSAGMLEPVEVPSGEKVLNKLTVDLDFEKSELIQALRAICEGFVNINSRLLRLEEDFSSSEYSPAPDLDGGTKFKLTLPEISNSRKLEMMVDLDLDFYLIETIYRLRSELFQNGFSLPEDPDKCYCVCYHDDSDGEGDNKFHSFQLSALGFPGHVVLSEEMAKLVCDWLNENWDKGE